MLHFYICPSVWLFVTFDYDVCYYIKWNKCLFQQNKVAENTGETDPQTEGTLETAEEVEDETGNNKAPSDGGKKSKAQKKRVSIKSRSVKFRKGFYYCLPLPWLFSILDMVCLALCQSFEEQSSGL